MNPSCLLAGLLLAGMVSAPLSVLSQAATNAPAPLRRDPTPNDTVKSPEVLADNRVAFRIYAPKATDVTLTGDWVAQGLGTAGKLAKDERGVWTLTVGPLPPDFYSYSFTVDGVRTVDPKNTMIKQGVSSLENMFFLPGREAAFEENQSVPHGVIRQVWYKSSTLAAQRRMHVYTPPGYDQGGDALPVFYLLHGGGDEDSGWSTIGRAGFIMDNLLAAQKAKSMIVVMPNGSLPRPEGPAPTDAAGRAALQDRFTNELLNDIVPFVEKNYRVKTGRDHRALAGLSMGGGQTLRVFTTHPDQFAYVAIWSAGLFNQKPEDFEQRNADFFKQAETLNGQLKLVSISVGDQDFALNGSRAMDEVFTRNHLKHEMHISSGGHTWINWRQYLAALAPKLFQ